MDGLPNTFGSRPSGRLEAGPEFAPRTKSSVPLSGVSSRSVDPSILRRIHDIDPHLTVRWNPLGIWWWPVSRPPPGASRGSWEVGVTMNSGRIKWFRHWPPFAADGRLVRFLREGWGRNLFILRSTTRDPLTKARLIGRMRDRQAKIEQAEFDAAWGSIDHGGLQRAMQADVYDSGFRGNWSVPAKVA